MVDSYGGQDQIQCQIFDLLISFSTSFQKANIFCVYFFRFNQALSFRFEIKSFPPKPNAFPFLDIDNLFLTPDIF
jgi:hypothetical protein